MRKNGQGGVDWDNPGTVGPEGPLPLIVFSKTDEHVGLLVGVYSGVRCTHDFDTMYANLDAYVNVKWEDKKPVRARLVPRASATRRGRLETYARCTLTPRWWAVLPCARRWRLGDGACVGPGRLGGHEPLSGGCACPAQHRAPAWLLGARRNVFCAWYMRNTKFLDNGQARTCARETLHELSLQHPDVLDAGWQGDPRSNKSFVNLHDQRGHK